MPPTSEAFSRTCRPPFAPPEVCGSSTCIVEARPRLYACSVKDAKHLRSQVLVVASVSVHNPLAVVTSLENLSDCRGCNEGLSRSILLTGCLQLSKRVGIGQAFATSHLQELPGMFHRLGNGGLAVLVVHHSLPPIVRNDCGDAPQVPVFAQESCELAAGVLPIADGVAGRFGTAGDLVVDEGPQLLASSKSYAGGRDGMRWDYDAFRKRALRTPRRRLPSMHPVLRSERYHVRFLDGRWNRHVFRPDTLAIDLVDELPAKRCRCQ